MTYCAIFLSTGGSGRFVDGGVSLSSIDPDYYVPGDGETPPTTNPTTTTPTGGGGGGGKGGVRRSGGAGGGGGHGLSRSRSGRGSRPFSHPHSTSYGGKGGGGGGSNVVSGADHSYTQAFAEMDDVGGGGGLTRGGGGMTMASVWKSQFDDGDDQTDNEWGRGGELQLLQSPEHGSGKGGPHPGGGANSPSFFNQQVGHVDVVGQL